MFTEEEKGYIVNMYNETFVSRSSPIAISRTFDFTVSGNVTSYQLAYNGTQDIKIILENP